MGSNLLEVIVKIFLSLKEANFSSIIAEQPASKILIGSPVSLTLYSGRIFAEKLNWYFLAAVATLKVT